MMTETRAKAKAVEFQSEGLSAVVEFFGVDGEQTLSTPKVVVSGVKHKRSFGSGPKDAAQNTFLLKVGKRKRHDEDVEDEVGNYGEDDDENGEEEEEEGRTGIQEKHKNITPPAAVETPTEQQQQKKKKKKPSKKERQKAKGEAKEQFTESSKEKPEIGSTSPSPEDGKNAASSDAVDSRCNKRSKKRSKKRRKVRSRQKNIYKDKRKNHEKPEHLQIGHKNFQGRPVTEATRVKLRLPPPHRRTFPQYDQVTESKAPDVGTMKLGIDDLMENAATADVGEVTGLPVVVAGEEEKTTGTAKTKREEKKIVSSSKRSKRKRSKYKNL